MFESINEMLTFFTIIFLPIGLTFYAFHVSFDEGREKNSLYKILIDYSDNEDE